MTTRVLPPTEWSKLDGTDSAEIFPWLTSGDVEITVLEDGDRIVGACSVLRMAHVEGAWIDPAYRGPSALMQLLAATWSTLRSRWIITSALTDRTWRRLRRFGAHRLPGEQVVMSVKEVSRLCRRLQS